MNRLIVALALVAGCGSNAGTNDMGSGCTMIEGVCLFAPTTIAVRTPCGDVTEFCDKTANPTPNLACLATPIVPGAGPATVTVTGFVHVFSSGPDSKGVSVAFYDAAALSAGQEITSTSPIAMLANVQLDPATQRACDAKNGCSLPSTTGCALPICNDGLGTHADSNKYCRDNGTDTSCNDRLRWESRYTIPGIPTNKQLVVRVTGPGGAADQTWASLVTWNVYLSTADHACTDNQDNDCLNLTVAANPTYQLNVNALSKSDYVNIPTVAGLGGGISAGKGAIAGEIHDCDNVRVGNVVVGTAPVPERSSYFNGNPIMTLPDSSRLATDRLGLYTALNMPPGKAHVVAAGLTSPGGALTSFGTFDAFIYQDTVSVINVNGGKPH